MATWADVVQPAASGLPAGSRFTTWVLGASAVVQLASLPFVGNRISGGDAQTYLELAADWSSWERLTSPEAFQENFWPAGYSGFLQLFVLFGDHQVLAIRIAQVVMVLALSLLGASLASEVSRAASRWALVLLAFSPTLFFAMWSIGYELLLALLLTLSLWLLWGQRPAWPIAASGMAFGLALIVQFRAAPVALVLLVLAWRSGRRALLVWLSALLVPLALWSLRTWLSVGSWQPWSSNGSYNLWNGNGPHSTGHNVFPLPPIPAETASYTDAAITWAIQNPTDFFDLTARKFLFLFYPTDIAGITERLPGQGLLIAFQWIYAIAMVVLLIVFVGSLAWSRGASLNQLALVFAAAALYLIPNILFIVEARFRIPVEPLLLVIAGATAQQWLIFRKRDERSVTT